MRGKRSKQYRKLMQQYCLHFGFREPYQILLDAAILEDAASFKMDFVSQLSKALHGQIKPMLTTCSIRHLSKRNDQNSVVMTHARDFERRRCNHHTLEEPLSEYECLKSVVDPKGTQVNKHKLVVASQNDKLRAYMRSLPGVPMIYLKRSVMVMEPMATSTEQVREQEEKGKFRAGLKGSRMSGIAAEQSGLKRKRSANDQDDIPEGARDQGEGDFVPPKKIRKRKGPSGPNPLSVRKAKKPAINTEVTTERSNAIEVTDSAKAPEDANIKPKRRRKHKSRLPDASEPPLGLVVETAA